MLPPAPPPKRRDSLPLVPPGLRDLDEPDFEVSRDEPDFEVGRDSGGACSVPHNRGCSLPFDSAEQDLDAAISLEAPAGGDIHPEDGALLSEMSDPGETLSDWQIVVIDENTTEPVAEKLVVLEQDDVAPVRQEGSVVEQAVADPSPVSDVEEENTFSPLAPVVKQTVPEEQVTGNDVKLVDLAENVETPLGTYSYGVVSHNYEGDRVFSVDDGSLSSNSPSRVYGGAKFRQESRKAKSVGDILYAQPRDIFWLEQAARYDFLSAEELAGFARVYSRLPRKEVSMWAKTTPAAALQRSRKLVKAGIFESFIVPSGMSSAIVFRPSARALTLYGAAAFTPRKPSTEELMHTSAVARLGLLFESQDMLRDRYYVMAEGEIRAFAKFGEATFVERGTEHWDETSEGAGDQRPDLSNRAQFLVEKPGGFIYEYDAADRPSVKGGYFRPDLVLLGRDGSRVAIEVERTAKPKTSMYQDKFSGYLKSGFTGVQYVCFSRAVADAVRRGIEATPGAENMIAVDLFPDSLMPLPLMRVERVTAARFPGVKRGKGRPATGDVSWIPRDPNENSAGLNSE